METLNEYCLCHIFDFLTPLEWAQISQGKYKQKFIFLLNLTFIESNNFH